MLRRLGNKTKLLPKLLPLFPENITTFIDMFMGSGAVTFAMVSRAKYIIANDKDNDVFNLFLTVKAHKEERENAIRMMPVHDALSQYWRDQVEHGCVWKAARFLMLSNFGYLGKAETLKIQVDGGKDFLEDTIKTAYYKIVHSCIKFMSCDFRETLNHITGLSVKFH